MMSESEIFAGFTLREAAAGRHVAVLHLVGADGLAATEESVFDEAGLMARVALLHARHGDASVSVAALRALQEMSGTAAVAAAPQAAPQPAPVRRPSESGTGLPGRKALLRALRDAMADAGLHEHGPKLAMLTLRGLREVESCHGAAAVAATLLGAADRLDDNLRRLDMLAHLGGPHFAACLPRAARRDAEAILRRLSHAVSESPIDTPCGPIAVRLDGAISGEVPGTAGGVEARAAALLAAAEEAMRAGDAVRQAA